MTEGEYARILALEGEVRMLRTELVRSLLGMAGAADRLADLAPLQALVGRGFRGLNTEALIALHETWRIVRDFWALDTALGEAVDAAFTAAVGEGDKEGGVENGTDSDG